MKLFKSKFFGTFNNINLHLFNNLLIILLIFSLSKNNFNNFCFL